MNYSLRNTIVHAVGDKLRFAESGETIEKPALLIQPSLDLLIFVGESDVAWKMKKMFESVQLSAETPNAEYIVVPLGLNTPYGFSAKQAEYVVNRMSCDTLSHFVVQFYTHLCLDDDIRRWINSEMIGQAAA